MKCTLVAGISCLLASASAAAGSLLRTPLPGGCALEADVRRDARPACLRLRCAGRPAQTLACDATALHQIDQAIPSADGRWLALLTVGEGHPWLEIVDLPALRSGEYRAACSINPFPGVLSLDAWLGGALRIGSDVDARLETRVRDLMQQTLNTYKAGVEVVSISIKTAQAPDEVLAVQREVSSAEQDKARREADAVAYRNKVVPEAEGRAKSTIQAAEGYKLSSVAEAKGETDRFNLVYDQYRAAPRVTRERMFLETMEKVIGGADRVIIDGKAGAVPILPLDQLRGRQPATQGQ